MLLLFGIVVADSGDFVKTINNCSCWCIPSYVNIMPSALPRDNVSAKSGILKGWSISSKGSGLNVHFT